jgi:hypothetical protein
VLAVVIFAANGAYQLSGLMVLLVAFGVMNLWAMSPSPWR